MPPIPLGIQHFNTFLNYSPFWFHQILLAILLTIISHRRRDIPECQNPWGIEKSGDGAAFPSTPGFFTSEYVQGRNKIFLAPGILHLAGRCGRAGQVLHQEFH